MAKYLVITNKKDFISESRNAKLHLETTGGAWCMIYDTKGEWVSGGEIQNGKFKQTDVNCLSDGMPRLQYASVIKEFPVGTEWDWVDEFLREQVHKIEQRLTDGLHYHQSQHEKIYEWLFDRLFEGKTLKEIDDMCWEDSDAIFNKIFG